MNEGEIRSLLVNLVESGNFPDHSFDIRHIEKIDKFKVMPDGKIHFGIERHPHIFGRPTLGMASSAFIEEYHKYELDFETRQVILLKIEKEDPVINYDLLASENVDSTLEGCNYDGQFKNIKSRNGLIDFAKKEFENLNWMGSYITDAQLPLDFEQKILSKLKKEFIYGMLESWLSYKEEVEEREE